MDPLAAPGAPAAPSPASTLTPALTPAQERDIRKAADEFEAMLLNSLLAPMFDGVDGDLFGGGAGERMFRPLLVQEYAKGVAEAGGLGLSASVAREMIALQTKTAER